MKILGRIILGLISWLFSLGITFGILGFLLALAVFHSFNKDLPDYSELAKYDPPTVTRLYASDGKLLAEYATEKRLFVPLKAIPKPLIEAFLSAEDKNFYSHTGIDITGIARAMRDNIVNYGQGKSMVGGSTITQQVVKNFLLSNEKSFDRKVKEAILAFRISQVYSKDKILELYLNEIYLGLGSYGVAAAAQNYFNKSMDELTPEEMALLAAQPKAPSSYNPKRSYDAAFDRRNWVLSRMRDDGRITQAQYEAAIKTPIVLRNREADEVVNADFFAEEVRRTLAAMYGEEVLYQGGLVVKTTINPTYQKAADKALRATLSDYDKRHGYRGALEHIGDKDVPNALDVLTKKYKPQLLETHRLARIKSLDAKQASLQLTQNGEGTLPFEQMKWTGAKRPADKLKVGDVVVVSSVGDAKKNNYELVQIPQVNGAMVVLDPHTGRVLAMSGGYSYGGTEFNRATQAKRQPGSSFKPFVYMAALENGFSPSSLIMDAPVEMEQGAGLPMWRPQNYHDDYLGPTTLRVGLEKSRNTMTVRLAQAIGIDRCLEMGKRLEIYENPPRNFSIVLGTSETTLLKLSNAYGMIVNGGKRIQPALIERIDDRHGNIIYRRDARKCNDCQVEIGETMPPVMLPPVLPDEREQVIDPRIAYQITSILEGVVQRGTGASAKSIGKIVGGKTGTTNESRDTWFVGFSPDLVAGVFVGYDQPRTLGAKETGASAALPAFISFMKEALADKPNTPFRVPRGIKFVRTDLKTGAPTGSYEVDGQGNVGATINEAYISGGPIYIPGRSSKAVLDALNNLGTSFDPDETNSFQWQDGAHVTVKEAPADAAPPTNHQPTPPQDEGEELPSAQGGTVLY